MNLLIGVDEVAFSPEFKVGWTVSFESLSQIFELVFLLFFYHVELRNVVGELELVKLHFSYKFLIFLAVYEVRVVFVAYFLHFCFNTVVFVKS